MGSGYIEAAKYKAEQDNRNPLAEGLSNIAESAASGYFKGKNTAISEDKEFKRDLFKEYIKNGVLTSKSSGQPLNTAQILHTYKEFDATGKIPDNVVYTSRKSIPETPEQKSERGLKDYKAKRGVDIELGLDPYGRSKATALGKKDAKGTYADLFDETEDTAVTGKPKVGDIVDGYKFLGGDPSSQSSWKKVK